MQLVLDALGWVFLLTGSFFCITAGVGMIRLPEFFSRSHAAGILDTLGAALILIGLAFQAGLTLVTVKLFLILFFILMTGPAAVHALARSALHAGEKPMLNSSHHDHADR